MPDIEPLFTQTVNNITVAQAVVLFVAARFGLLVWRWFSSGIGRIYKFGFYVVASSLLRFRWVVRVCAFVLVRWQVDLGHAILDLHPDHLTVRPSVGGVQGTKDASATLRIESSSRQFAPQWGTDLRPDRLDQDNQWSAWAKHQDRRADYRNLLEKELRRAYRFPTDT